MRRTFRLPARILQTLQMIPALSALRTHAVGAGASVNTPVMGPLSCATAARNNCCKRRETQQICRTDGHLCLHVALYATGRVSSNECPTKRLLTHLRLSASASWASCQLAGRTDSSSLGLVIFQSFASSHGEGDGLSASLVGRVRLTFTSVSISSMRA